MKLRIKDVDIVRESTSGWRLKIGDQTIWQGTAFKYEVEEFRKNIVTAINNKIGSR